MLVLPHDAWDSPLVALLASEMVKDEPGQEAVLDRLVDLLVIAVLRAWFSRPDSQAPALYRAYGDPIVGRALRMLQNSPAHPWTVATLAAEIGISRAALARRFTELVGEPPMTFLTGWRLALAADLLREPDATIGSVAQEVGYGSPFALSARLQARPGREPEAAPGGGDLHRLTGRGQTAAGRTANTDQGGNAMDPFLAEIRMFAGNFAPRGWASCDGQLLPINQNQALFSLLGTTYGGDGRRTFALPDLRGRVPMHHGTGPGPDPHEQGQMAGSEPAAPATGEPSVHTPPYTVLNFIIALQGIFPARD